MPNTLSSEMVTNDTYESLRDRLPIGIFFVSFYKNINTKINQNGILVTRHGF